MRAYKLGRWAGLVVAIVAAGAGVALGASSIAAADEVVEPTPPDMTAEPTAGPEASPADFSWE